MTNRGIARRLASESLEAGTPLAWFETLYAQAARDESVIPWADKTVNPNLSEWLENQGFDGADRKALVVGCGLGDDAEALASIGFQVTAFDISSTCIEWCRQRFSQSVVKYLAADLFDPPVEWRQAFAFVFEAYTLQVLPPELRRKAMERLAESVGPSGGLLIVSRGRDETDDPGNMPWPLVRTEFDQLKELGLTEVRFEDYIEKEEPPVRRFRVEYRRT